MYRDGTKVLKLCDNRTWKRVRKNSFHHPWPAAHGPQQMHKRVFSHGLWTAVWKSVVHFSESQHQPKGEVLQPCLFRAVFKDVVEIIFSINTP